MEYMGTAAFIMACYLIGQSLPDKIKRLEAGVKRLERKQKGESNMSKLINELVGKECKIKSDDALSLVGSQEMQCVVLDTDDEWMKVQYTDKKKNRVTKLIRIENVDGVEIL